MAKTILFIDDSETVLNVARACLEKAGYIFLGAKDLSELSAHLQGKSIDLVIVDEVMPELMGHDLVEYLAEAIKPHPPILLASTMSPAKLQERAKACGATGAFSKGSNLADLLITEVQKHLAQVS
ncbi:MAG: response regulator [Myxococcota bacterium]